jgi:hypothetical protein
MASLTPLSLPLFSPRQSHRALLESMINRARTLEPLWLAIAAFVLAGLAQSIFSGLFKVNFPPAYAWLLYLVAAVFFVMGFGRTPVSQFAKGRSLHLPENPAWLSRQQIFLLVLAIFSSATSFIRFGKPELISSAWVSHLVSMLLLIAAFIPFSELHIRFQKPSAPSRTRLLRILGILAVFLIAIVARLWQLKDFPFGSWNDEAVNGLAAAQILNDPGYRPIFVDTMPSHFIYMISFAFSLFGVNPFALRLVTAVLGIAGVVFAFLLFRRWFGTAMAIVAAGLLAVMRYDLTFSRFGVNAISTPAFELAALYFLDRALAEKHIQDFAWLGITLGLGLSFYTGFRLFPVALFIFLVCLFMAVIIKHGFQVAFRSYLGGLLPHGLVTVLALAITLMPVIHFVWQSPADFFARTSSVSIFNHRDEPNLGKALWSNTHKHLEMFNVAGDRNGRHNLPGVPMLDPIMGILFVLGATYAIWRWRDLPNLLMLLVFIAMLQNGVLSLDFEAPQSLRAIGVIPALVYFAAIPLAAMVLYVESLLAPKAGVGQDFAYPSPLRNNGYWQLALIPLLAIIAYINLNTFFNKYKSDPSSWAQSSTAETIAANTLKQNAGAYDFVLSAMYSNHPTVQFLAGDIKNVQRWTATDHFPLVRDPNRGVILLFDETLLPAYHDIQRVYPTVKYIEHHAPTGRDTVLYEAILTPKDLQSISGVEVRYYEGNTADGKAVKKEILPQINVHWSAVQPAIRPFVAEFHSTLVAPEYGGYRFILQGARDAKLWLDESLVDDSPIMLARGAHTLRVQASDDTDTLELLWQPPNSTELQPIPAANLFRPSVTNSGLLGAYYPTPDWSGDPAFKQVDPQIAFYFHIIPLPRPYSVEWTGKLYAPQTGQYAFALESRDGSSLKLDNQLVVENPEGNAKTENNVALDEGWHDIFIHFQDKTGGTRIYLYWTPPGAKESELIPSRFLSPPMGQYPNLNETEN